MPAERSCFRHAWSFTPGELICPDDVINCKSQIVDDVINCAFICEPIWNPLEKDPRYLFLKFGDLNSHLPQELSSPTLVTK